MLQKWPDATRYIGYFQAGTNTYAPLAALREKYEAVLAQPGVVGLSIATRLTVCRRMWWSIWRSSTGKPT